MQTTVSFSRPAEGPDVATSSTAAVLDLSSESLLQTQQAQDEQGNGNSQTAFISNLPNRGAKRSPQVVSTKKARRDVVQ